jgi:hypothetical protein
MAPEEPEISDEDRAVMLAVERFAARVAVPILHEHEPNIIDQVGTGTLFDHNGHLLLITARHIFDDIKAVDLVIPSTGTTELHGIGPYRLLRPNVEEIDIAIAELQHQPTIERARGSWQILTVENIAEPSKDGHFVLAGYPSERLVPARGLLGGTLLTLHTERIVDTPKNATEPVHPDLDLFFRYEREGQTLDGGKDIVPKLHGCSGASVWEYSEPADMIFWSAEQCLTVVGVQSAYSQPRGYFRAKRWAYVQDMIRREFF